MKHCEYCNKPMAEWKNRFCNHSCASSYQWRDMKGDGLRYTDIKQRDKERREMEIKYGFVVCDKLFDLYIPPPPPPLMDSDFTYQERLKEITGEPKRYIDGEITLNELRNG